MQKMELIIMVTLLAFSAETRLIHKKCNGEMFKDNEVIKTGINSPYQLALDYDKNILFFSHTKENEDKSEFESAFINLETKVFNIVEGIKDGFANAVDNENHIVYLGGKDGIYTFDYKTNQAKRIEGTNHTIWHLFFKNHLYYSNYPDEHVYVIKKEKSERVPELRNTRGMLVALDNNENIYFANSSGLFIFKKTSGTVTLIGDYVLNSLTNDIEGNIVFSTHNGIYYIDMENKLEKVISMDNIYGVAVERDGNLICALEDSIARLKIC